MTSLVSMCFAHLLQKFRRRPHIQNPLPNETHTCQTQIKASSSAGLSPVAPAHRPYRLGKHHPTPTPKHRDSHQYPKISESLPFLRPCARSPIRPYADQQGPP